jgi:hypothetical protein
MHLSVGFIGDPAGQLNTLANSGELTTARALHQHNIIFIASYSVLESMFYIYTWQVLVHEDQYHVESGSMKGVPIHTMSRIIELLV